MDNTAIDFDYINYLHELYERSDKVVPEFLIRFGTTDGVATYCLLQNEILGIKPYQSHLVDYGFALAQDILDTILTTINMYIEGYSVYERNCEKYIIGVTQFDIDNDLVNVYFPKYNDVLMETCYIAGFFAELLPVERQYTDKGYLVQFQNFNLPITNTNFIWTD